MPYEQTGWEYRIEDYTGEYFEPIEVWVWRAGGGGRCKFSIAGAPIIKRKTGRLEWRSIDGSIWKFSFDCPTYTPKEQE